MKQCWSYASSDRPSFLVIHKNLTDLQTQLQTSAVLDWFSKVNKRLASEVHIISCLYKFESLSIHDGKKRRNSKFGLKSPDASSHILLYRGMFTLTISRSHIWWVTPFPSCLITMGCNAGIHSCSIIFINEWETHSSISMGKPLNERLWIFIIRSISSMKVVVVRKLILIHNARYLLPSRMSSLPDLPQVHTGWRWCPTFQNHLFLILSLCLVSIFGFTVFC